MRYNAQHLLVIREINTNQNNSSTNREAQYILVEGKYKKNLIHTHTQKKKELSNHKKIRRNLKCISLRERSQCRKATYSMFPFV